MENLEREKARWLAACPRCAYQLLNEMIKNEELANCSNSYLAKLFNVTSRTVQNWISKLKDAGIVTCSYVKQGIRKITFVFSENTKESSPDHSVTPLYIYCKNNTGLKGDNAVLSVIFKKMRKFGISKDSSTAVVNSSPFQLSDINRLMDYYLQRSETKEWRKSVKKPSGLIISMLKRGVDQTKEGIKKMAKQVNNLPVKSIFELEQEIIANRAQSNAKNKKRLATASKFESWLSSITDSERKRIEGDNKLTARLNLKTYYVNFCSK